MEACKDQIQCVEYVSLEYCAKFERSIPITIRVTFEASCKLSVFQKSVRGHVH